MRLLIFLVKNIDKLLAGLAIHAAQKNAAQQRMKMVRKCQY
jgi:hypothetical protein